MTCHTFTHVESTHAHPSTTLPPQTPSEKHYPMMQRLSPTYHAGLFTNELQLRGLSGEGRSTANDVYCPDVRRSCFNNNNPINHLDVVSCWKGLDLKQAEEVLTWERIFRKALEEQIADSVQELFPTLPAIDDDIFTITHYVDIDLEECVHRMLDYYFGSKPGQRPEHTWALSDGDLPGFAYNFVRTRDCFIDASPRPCVQVDLVFSLPTSSIVGEIIWQPPNISFGHLPVTLPPGALFSIHPEWRLPNYGNTSRPQFAVFPDKVDFKVDSQCLSFETSDAEHSFKATVPHSDTLNSAGTTMQTTLTAKSTMHFPAGVRFEGTSRYNIKLWAMTRTESLQGDDTSSRMLQRTDSMSPEGKFPASQDTTMFLDKSNEAVAEVGTKPTVTGPRFLLYAEWNKENATRISAVLEEHINSVTCPGAKSDAHQNDKSSKRKASTQMPISPTVDVKQSKATRCSLDTLDDDSSPELTAKRQRVYHSEAVQSIVSETIDMTINEDGAAADAWADKHLDDLGHLSTTCVGEAQADRAPWTFGPRDSRSYERTHGSKSRAYTASTGASRVMPALRKKGSVKRMLFVHPKGHPKGARRADSPIEEAPRTATNEKNMTPACLEDHGLLPGGAHYPDQATIRRNYAEFVRMSRHMKLDSDEAREAMEYESFFLNSPSGASSVSDGMSAMSLDAD